MIRAQFLAGAGALASGTQVAQIVPYTPTFRFSVVGPQSGPDGALGRQLVAGVRGAVDEINRDRPSYQSLVLYNVYDDHNVAAEATVQADFATSAPDAMAVIGHLSATTTLATQQLYSNAQIPVIVPTVTDDRITERGYRNVFRLPVKDSDEGGLIATYAIKTGSKSPTSSRRTARTVRKSPPGSCAGPARCTSARWARSSRWTTRPTTMPPAPCSATTRTASCWPATPTTWGR